MNTQSPYDQRLARLMIKPFSGTRLHPNHLTTLTFILGITSALLFAFAIKDLAWLAALLYMVAVFSDHLDGELARMDNKTSRFGHDYDYIVGGINYMLLFIATGYGLYTLHGHILWLIAGLAAGLSNPVILLLRMRMEVLFGQDAVEHPSGGGFEIEDGIYLIGPLTWLFGVEYFFVPYALGTLGYLVWTIVEFRKHQAR